MRELVAFAITVLLSLTLVTLIGSKRKRHSRYERSSYQEGDWQKLDRGIDPTLNKEDGEDQP